MAKTGIHAALISAVLFGMSPVACKLLVGDMSPALLAGLLYLGSGLGLTGVVLRLDIPVMGTLCRLTPKQWLNLLGAVVSGGIAAPLLLAFGILNGTASEVSLLLNFEAVATTAIAWAVFHEHVGRRVWAGKLLIVFASALVIAGGGELRFSIPGLAVLGACLLWGVDNNLTRELESLPATLLACIKGLSSGAFNLALSFLVFHSNHIRGAQVAGALVIGALSYGASLVLFIHALRQIGSARTSTWFASGPLIGTALSILLLHESPPAQYWLSALLMVSGMFLLYGERHRHEHEHDAAQHSHLHTHNEHHRHQHDDEATGAHEHFHVHEPMVHSHVHWPDLHHRHRH